MTAPVADIVTKMLLYGDEDGLITALNEVENMNYFFTENGIASCHLAAYLGHVNIILVLLERGLDINCKTSGGDTLLHSTTRYGNVILAINLITRGIDINSKNNNDETALHIAARWGHPNISLLLLTFGIDIAENINEYIPNEIELDEDELDEIENRDSRPTIFAELEDRRKRPLFDSFINHYIEYQPYINNIYTQCYPNINLARPRVGWIRAEAIRDKYYFDEIFFYLHMHIANFFINRQPDAIVTTSSRNSMTYSARHNGKTSTLMIILTDRLRMYLKPNQNLGVEVPYVQKDDDDDDDDDNNGEEVEIDDDGDDNDDDDDDDDNDNNDE